MGYKYLDFVKKMWAGPFLGHRAMLITENVMSLYYAGVSDTKVQSNLHM